ncbi:MAG: hypothetical protein ACK55U_17185, partial [Bacteroidota bacterium]
MTHFATRLVLLSFFVFLGICSIAQPTLDNPTITAVTTTSATLGGRIATGSSITAHGTAFNTTAGVIATNNPQDGGSVADGSI